MESHLTPQTLSLLLSVIDTDRIKIQRKLFLAIPSNDIKANSRH